MDKEKITIQIDDEVIELKGAELNEFIKLRDELKQSKDAIEKNMQEQKALKISAYKKLGLTDEEIGAII